MRHDYRFDGRPARRRPRTGRWIVAGVAVLVAALASARFLDAGLPFDATRTPAGDADKHSIPLTLPDPHERSEAPPPSDAGETPQRSSAPEPAPVDAAPAAIAAAGPGPGTPAAREAPSDEAAAGGAALRDETPDEQPTGVAPSAGAAASADVADAPAAPQAAAADASAGAPDQARWLEHEVAKGESLARIFDRHGLDARVLHGIVNSSREARSLSSIRPGQTLRLLIGDDEELERLELQRSRVETLRVSLVDDGYTVEQVSRDVERRVTAAAGTIESSLFVDGQKAGLSDSVIMQLAEVFGWDIDFALEIRAGDRFRVLYEEHYVDGEKLRDGPILAAEFTNRGNTHTAVRYENRSGEVAYYDADGHGKRRAFIRTPIKFARVSSRYNPKRWHPVLKRWRAHRGVDYAAPTGTPVKATGDGRVVFRGTKGGYGRTVILEHAGKYTTLYAHLSRYAKRASKGKRVKQGQVIGYVGKSGLATGPHLHYEFRIDGVHKDPLRVQLPKTLPLPKSEMGRFRNTAAPLLARLDRIPAGTMVATAEAASGR